MLLTEAGKESPYLGAMMGSRLAGNRSEGKDGQLGADARAIKAHLDRIDRESLIRQNVSQQAVSAWDRLTGQSLGLPEVGHSLSQDLYAELAWPEHTPPVAILTGRHSVHAGRWRDHGWEVH
jgi:hypothetical protein